MPRSQTGNAALAVLDLSLNAAQFAAQFAPVPALIPAIAVLQGILQCCQSIVSNK